MESANEGSAAGDGTGLKLLHLFWQILRAAQATPQTLAQDIAIDHGRCGPWTIAYLER